MVRSNTVTNLQSCACLLSVMTDYSRVRPLRYIPELLEFGDCQRPCRKWQCETGIAECGVHTGKGLKLCQNPKRIAVYFVSDDRKRVNFIKS